MQKFTKEVIVERRESLLQSTNVEKTKDIENNAENESKKHLALLDLLLQATVDGQSLTDEDIREEVETFMFEGHDTTTSGISFTLYLISRYPKVQEKLFAEIREVIGDNKTHAPTYAQLQNLHYMECVIKESLRLYPPVPIIGRYLNRDADLSKHV